LAGILLTTGAAFVPAQAADVVLSGTIASASGQKLEGVTVSAKREGTTITTSVYTDESGNYYFPPLESGKYNIWAQALGFETTKSTADLAATKKTDMTLQAMTDPERRIRQLPAAMLV